MAFIIDDKILKYPQGYIKISAIFHIGKLYNEFGKYKFIINDKFILEFNTQEDGKNIQEKLLELMKSS